MWEILEIFFVLLVLYSAFGVIMFVVDIVSEEALKRFNRAPGLALFMWGPVITGAFIVNHIWRTSKRNRNGKR